jgi:hypothetical protein
MKPGRLGTSLVAAVYRRRTSRKGPAMRTYVIGAMIVLGLGLPAIASAKGPSSAAISGPGLERSLAIRGDREMADNRLGTLTMASGFFAQMFGQTPDPTLAARPDGILGPRYTAVYVVPGPNDIRSRVVQSIYPYAKPVALTFLKPGQTFWHGRKAHGGWFRATPALKRMLVRAGLPSSPPS